MFGNSDKSQSIVALMSKRNLEENDKNRVNYENHNWIHNSFNDNNINNNNNKRVKTEKRWTPWSPSNCLTANPSPFEEMNVIQDNDDNEDDQFNDGLDEYITQAISCSQSIPVPTQPNTSNYSQPIRTSDQNMASQTNSLVKSNEDVIMNSSGSHPSSNSSEASEGRLKILESRNAKLKDEVFQFKTQSIQSQHKIRQLERDYDIKTTNMLKHYESSLSFEKNEKTLQIELLCQLQHTLKQFAPNAPIVKTTAEYLRQRRRSSIEGFSQSKLTEFYAPLSAGMASNQSQFSSTPSSFGDVLVPESQSSVGGKRPKLSGSFPSQIGPSQILSVDCSMNSQPMDINSPNEQVVIGPGNSQTSQTARMAWNSTRQVLEHKFCADQQSLTKFFFESQKEFDDQWIRDNQQIDDWTTTLNQLNDELDFNLNL